MNKYNILLFGDDDQPWCGSYANAIAGKTNSTNSGIEMYRGGRFIRWLLRRLTKN